MRERPAPSESRLQMTEIGTVLTTGDGVARVFGLKSVLAGELVEFDGGVKGMVLNLETNNVGIVVLGDDAAIKEGSTVKRTEKIVSVPVGNALLGRVVNAIGEPIDGRSEERRVWKD